MRVLVACEFSGVVRGAFQDLGHDAWSCDLLPTESPGPHMGCDARDILDDSWDLIIAHPPCTRLCNSGVRWLHRPPRGRSRAEMWAELDEGAALFSAFLNAPAPMICVENPVMHRYARERITNYAAPQIVQPWWFGDAAFKATGLHLRNLPPLVPTNRLTPPQPGTHEHKQWSAVHRASPGPGRWKERSRTFPGMAAAMAEQWGSAA